FYGSAAWGDYDNDGRLDLLMAGLSDSSQFIGQLWHNNGNGNFTLNTNAPFAGVAVGSVAWGDYDNDGRLDFMVDGYYQAVATFQLWRNVGNGLFQQIPTSIPGIYYGSAIW